jgi:hypothetical protein
VVPLHGRAASLGAVTGSTAGLSLHSDMNEFERRDSAKNKAANYFAFRMPRFFFYLD